MSAHIPIYGLNWHFQQSPALRKLLVSPLSPFMKFEQLGWDGDGDLPGFRAEWLRKTPIIFFQLPPPESIHNLPDSRIIWIPMWDQARGYDMKWWNHLPKNLRVVSFSNEISQRARAVGLNTLDMKYFLSPSECEQVDWNKELTLFYWNRTGMVGEAFLGKLCKSLGIEILLYRRRIDPAYYNYDFKLPKKLGKTLVKELTFDGANAHEEYIKYLNLANIFIAPRVSEGVGLSFIEALAGGSAVFAFDAPTMNEYISHKINGYLLKHHNKSAFNIMDMQLRRVIRLLGYKRLTFNHPVTDMQNWTEIKKLDLKVMGDQARQGQLDGYLVWKNILPRYASFILDW